MKINTVKYFFKESARSLKRNRTLSIASAATVAVTLLILGVFILLLWNVDRSVTGIQSKLQVKVYFEETATDAQRQDVRDKIEKVKGISSVGYETKNEALDNLKKQVGADKTSILEGIDPQQMPDSYIVKVTDPKYINDVVKSIKGMAGISKIYESKELVDRIVAISKTLQWVGVVLLIILSGVSLFLIGNTIKLTVYSRRREIGIMKYIGATDWFIRWPFIMEGMFIGIFGAFITTILLFLGYNGVYDKLSKSLSFILADFVSPSVVLTTLFPLFILGGLVIGALGSIQAIRKFLQV